MICPGVIQGAAVPQKTAELEHYNCTRISENKPHQARTVRAPQAAGKCSSHGLPACLAVGRKAHSAYAMAK
jgi:hypothetical protein